MTAEEAVLTALDWEPSIDCALVVHEQSGNGCRAEEPGEYVIEDLHKVHTDSGRPTRLIVCRAKQIWFRGRTNHTIRCDLCGATMLVSERFRFLGHYANLPAEDAS